MLAFPMAGGVAWDATGAGRGLCTGWWWCWWCRQRGCRREVIEQVMVSRAALVVRLKGRRRWYRWRCEWWGCCRCCGAVGDATGDESLVMSRVLQVCRRRHGCCSVSRGGWCL